MAECLCGCGLEAGYGKKFIYGHTKNWTGLCKCGCGKVTNPGYDFVHGHNGSCFTREQLDARNKKISENKHLTDTEKEHLRQINLGEKNPVFGKSVSEELRKRRGDSIKKKYEDSNVKQRHDIAVKEALQRPEIRERISRGLMGHTVSDETKAKLRDTNVATWSDIKLRKAHSEKLTERMKDLETKEKLREVNIGELNPAWNGGSSFESYSVEFNDALKLIIRKRDSFSCILCNVTEEEATVVHAVHHIDYNKMSSAHSNLITLCHKCHAKTNGSRDYWQQLLSSYIKEFVSSLT